MRSGMKIEISTLVPLKREKKKWIRRKTKASESNREFSVQSEGEEEENPSPVNSRHNN